MYGIATITMLRLLANINCAFKPINVDMTVYMYGFATIMMLRLLANINCAFKPINVDMTSNTDDCNFTRITCQNTCRIGDEIKFWNVCKFILKYLHLITQKMHYLFFLKIIQIVHSGDKENY